MARTKDALRHAGLARDQVREAYLLVRDELRRTSRDRDELTSRINELQDQFNDLSEAATALGMDLSGIPEVILHEDRVK
jgi:septal ring factor EnvC (AmiA/AmiB activator)